MKNQIIFPDFFFLRDFFHLSDLLLLMLVGLKMDFLTMLVPALLNFKVLSFLCFNMLRVGRFAMSSF